MRVLRGVVALVALSLGGAATAAAQRPVELGVDAGVQFDLEDPKTTVVGIPIQNLRVGFFLSDKLSLEPSVALNWIKVSGEDSFSTLGLDASLLYHFTADTERSQLYVRPFAGLMRVSGGGESVNQMQAGAGLGVKLPMATRMALRLEGNVRHGFETDDIASGTALGMTIGFSFFTR